MDLDLTPAQRAVQALAREFAQERVAPIAREMDELGEMPVALVREMGKLGLLGGPLPAEFGGGGWDPLSLALCYEELGRADSSVRGFMTVHTSLVSQCLLAWGTPAQNQAYLPLLAQGDWIGCYCLTEPGAGSDAASLKTFARAEDDSYRLAGEKVWITNGNLARLGLVFATRDPAARHRGLCAFLVEMDAAVLGGGLRREPMPGRELGHRASDHAHLFFEGLLLPATALLGEPGQGFKVAMSALDRGRLGVAAGAVGVAQACLDACLLFARSRRQFGQRIGDFEMIQAALADMAADVEAARALVYRAAWLQGQ